MKALILTCILVPLWSKRVTFEYLALCVFLSIPMLYSSWEIPFTSNVAILTDKLSAMMAMLSFWTCILMSLLKVSKNYLSLNISLLLLSLLGFFSVTSILSFFILFEFSLIPTACLILGWGGQPERLQAGYYFVFYTITFSIPLMMSLIWLFYISGSKYFYFDNLYSVFSGYLGLLVLTVFMIKLPLFMTHFWLPKAHVQAPVVGSMILAGVLLKTGGYGIMRVFLFMKSAVMANLFKVLGLLGMVYVCVVCLYSTDLKQVIAYSSVSHMNFMIVGLMNNSLTSYSGGVIMMISHGLCSSLMFMLADMTYTRCGSRSMLINKGFLVVAPPMAMLWGLSVLFNMGLPPTAGSLSEILIITSSSSFLLKLMFGLYLFLSAFYSVYLYILVNHGKSELNTFNIEIKEVLLSIAHLYPLSVLTVISKLATI